METETKTNRSYLESLAKEKEVYTAVADELGNTVRVENPKSLREAESYSKFWNSVLSEFKRDIGEIQFLYQEKDKELPLSRGKNLLRKLGSNIKPKTVEGDVKIERVHPELIHYINSYKNLAILVTQKQEWKRLNSVAQNSSTFSVPEIETLKPFYYHVNLPLECILKVSFKLKDFLNKPYVAKK